MSSKSHKRDRDGRDGERSSRHGSSYGREGPRDGRDRDTRAPSWREADTRQYGFRDSRPGSAAGITHNTPPKPRPAGTAALGAGRGGPLGGSAISNAILEAAKRRAQEQAAAADEEEEGETGAARKRARHEPIVWQSPARQEAAHVTSGDAKQPESLQERLQREAAEFKQLQHDVQPADGAANKQRQGSRHHHHSRGRSPSSSSSGSEGSPHEQRNADRHQTRRRHSRSSSRSRSRSSSEEGMRSKKKVGGRWADDEHDEDTQPPQQPKLHAEDNAGTDAERRVPKSRWAADEDDEGPTAATAADLEEGEAPGAAVEDELEELNRRERAELEAAANEEDSEAAAGGRAIDDEEDDLLTHKNLLEESRRVEEYERLNRISEGTYGVVHRARLKSTGEIFALKKLKLENCPDGFPQTSIREMNIMLSCKHPNIVNVSEIVIGSRDAVYMVMEYIEHDLKYVLELQKAKKVQPFSIGHIKNLMQQLLAGVHYMHDHWIIHRDLKTSNLLYSNNGELKICDFGLARQYGSPLRAFTPQVVTLWYRAIERLLGDPLYSTALDMWSVGCIMAEFILGEPLFQGRGELDQIKRIFDLLGTPTEESWPGWDQLPDSKNLQWKPRESQLRKKFPAVVFGTSQPTLSDKGFDLLSRLLDMNPKTRITAKDALQHEWFQEAPRAVNVALMPSFPQRHQGKDGFRDKLGNPSPGAVGPMAGFGL